MSTITFRGAYIRFADLRIKSEAGVFARIHLTSDISSPVRKAMSWNLDENGEPLPLPDCFDSSKLSGKLTSRNLVLTPNQKELRQHEIQMECSEVADFQLFRVTNDDGESTHDELRFIARTNEPSAIAKIENYMRLAGTSEGALKITYDDQAKLPLGKPDGDGEVNCVDCANEVPFMKGSTTVHASGQPCRKATAETESKKESSLASAREAAGGTHAARGKRRPPQDETVQ